MEKILITWSDHLSALVQNRLVQAATIIVLSVVAARVVNWLFRVATRRWTAKTRTDFDDRLLDLLHGPLFVSIVLIGLATAAERLQLPPLVRWTTIAALKTIAIVVWLTFSIRFSRLLLELLNRHQDRFPIVQTRMLPLLKNVASVVLIGAGVYFFFLSWQIDVTAWLASAGIIGLALSFAAKDTLANLFAGVSILADAPYRVGDWIVLDSGERGCVTHIGIRSTRLLTRDDIELTIPNSVMGNTKITNESGGPYKKERVRVTVSVAYGSDVDTVRALLLDVGRLQPNVCRDPEPRVRFRAFGDSGLEFDLLCWIEEPAFRGLILDSLNTEVYKRFQREGVEIPFPKRDVYIRRMPGPTPT
jgi:MscS family membrane protein